MMTSLEIAELTNKLHKNVLRDIEAMISSLKDGSNLSHEEVQGLTRHQDEPGSDLSSQYKSTSYKDGSGIDRPMYELGKDLTLTLISGYNVKLRFAVVRRWRELEEASRQPQLPKDYREAVAALLHSLEAQEQITHERDEAIRTKAEIGNRREASAMGRASAEAKKAKAAEERLAILKDESDKYKTVRAFCARMKLSLRSLQKLGQATAKYCRVNGLEVKRVPDDLYGEVNSYPVEALSAVSTKALCQ